MERGVIQIYYGEGRGKSTAALGNALRKADAGKNVIIVQFLKAKKEEPGELLQRLEPEIKFFRFEKLAECFADLSEDEKKEESANMKNGLNFARKVLATSECDLLVLDLRSRGCRRDIGRRVVCDHPGKNGGNRCDLNRTETARGIAGNCG